MHILWSAACRALVCPSVCIRRTTGVDGDNYVGYGTSRRGVSRPVPKERGHSVVLPAEDGRRRRPPAGPALK